MDRASMLQALQAAGADVTAVTDATPDEVLAAWLASLQATTQPDVPPADAVQQMSDVTAPALPAPSAPAIPGVPADRHPQAVTLKFADNTPAAIAAGLGQWAKSVNGIIGDLTAKANAASQQLATVNAHATQQANAAKFADVSAFVGKLATPDAAGMVRITPAQKAGLAALLMKCDSGVVRKFSDGSNRQGSELDERKADLLASLPKIRAAGETMKDPMRGPGVGGGNIDPDRRRKMLSATPQGREILKLEAKTA